MVNDGVLLDGAPGRLLEGRLAGASGEAGAAGRPALPAGPRWGEKPFSVFSLGFGTHLTREQLAFLWSQRPTENQTAQRRVRPESPCRPRSTEDADSTSGGRTQWQGPGRGVLCSIASWSAPDPPTP